MVLELRPVLTYLREVAVRYSGQRRKGFAVRGPEGVATFVRSILKDNAREHFVALYLDGAHQVIGYSIVSIGTANSATVHPRETLQPALLLGATALVVAHNHPSGQLEPSCDDREVTDRLRSACELLGLKMLDHVILTEDGHLSLTTGERSTG